MLDWGLFTDWHEAVPHLAFELVTGVIGWIVGHYFHDRRHHPERQGDAWGYDRPAPRNVGAVEAHLKRRQWRDAP